MTFKNCRSFTIVEILIAVVLVGVIAAFAMPAYNKAIRKSVAQEAVNNLRFICAAQESAKEELGQYEDDWFAVFGTSNVSDINQKLGLSIIEHDGLRYTCMAGPNVTCAAYLPGQWTFLAGGLGGFADCSDASALCTGNPGPCPQVR